MRTTLVQERNPFSDAASMVLRTALSSPSRAWGIRELARLSSTSPALTALVLKRLERLGYASREATGQARLLDPTRLLWDWAAWYAIKPLKEFRYVLEGKAAPKRILNLMEDHRGELPGRWALTSMAGASLVAPFAEFREIHVQLPKAEKLRQTWRRLLRLTPDAEGPIHLIEPYYSFSGSEGIRETHRLPVVSDIQLFLDCYRYPVRGREQAEHILSRLAQRWKRG